MTKDEFVLSSYRQYLFSWSRLGLLFGMPAILLLAPLDYVVTPEHFPTFLGYRFATALGLGVLYALNRVRVQVTYQSLLGLVAAALVSAMVALMVAHLDGHRSVYFAGFMLVLVFVCSFLPLRSPFGIAAAAIVQGLYLVPVLVYDTVTDIPFFTAANSLMLVCAATLLLFQHINYRRLIAEFGLRYEIERHSDILEEQVRGRTAELSQTVQDLRRAVTEREAAVRETHQVNDSLAALIKASPLSIMALRPDGAVTLWNPAAERTFGWSAAEVVGGSNPMIAGGKQAEFRANLERVLRGETIARMELARRRKDGAAITLSLSAGPTHGPAGEITGVMAVLEDVTEHRRMERAILQAKEEWEETFDIINDAITVHDRDFTIVRANRAAAALLGGDLQAILRRKCYQSYHGADAPPAGCPSCESLVTGESSVTEVFEPHIGKHLEIRALPRRDRDGRVIGIVHVVRDLTEANRLKAQLFQAQKMEAVGQLAGGIAHDFNNIISAVTGFADLLRLKLAADDPRRRYVDQIISAADRAANLTRSLLSFSRTQAIALRPVELNDIVRELKKLLARLIGEDIELAADLAAEDLVVSADPGQIEQLLMNLATNARDAMPRGGRLTIATERFEMDAEFASARGYGAPGAYALLRVADTGHGIDSAAKGRIFEPFFTTKEPGKGTGLGLAMVYGIVKQHNGFIAVESEPGRGTQFMIWIPLVEAAAVGVGGPPSALLPRGSETILVAEDDPVLRELSREILEGHGYRVLVAADGDEAIRVFRENAEGVRLLLLDMVMPHRSGKEAGREILASSPEVKVLYMTGHTPEAISQRDLLEPGMNVIAKPFSPASLLQAVRGALDGRPHQSAARPL